MGSMDMDTVTRWFEIHKYYIPSKGLQRMSIFAMSRIFRIKAFYARKKGWVYTLK